MLHIVALASKTPSSFQDELRNEKGLSFYIEYDNLKILFDTGTDDSFMLNARRLGCDIGKLNFCVLSHRDMSHSGGYRELYESGSAPTQLFVGTGFFEKKYEKKGVKYVRTDSLFEKEDLLDNDIWVTEVEGKTNISRGVWLMTGFSRENAKAEHCSDRYILKNWRFMSDPFSDETCLCFSTSKGLVLLTGTNHHGAIDMLDKAKEYFGENIYAVIGGFRPDTADKAMMRLSIEKLIDSGVRLVACSRSRDEAEDLLVGNINVTNIEVGDEFFIE